MDVRVPVYFYAIRKKRIYIGYIWQIWRKSSEQHMHTCTVHILHQHSIASEMSVSDWFWVPRERQTVFGLHFLPAQEIHCMSNLNIVIFCAIACLSSTWFRFHEKWCTRYISIGIGIVLLFSTVFLFLLFPSRMQYYSFRSFRTCAAKTGSWMILTDEHKHEQREKKNYI